MQQTGVPNTRDAMLLSYRLFFRPHVALMFQARGAPMAS